MSSHETYWDTYFTCITAINNDLIPAKFHVKFHMDFITDDPYKQVIAYERLKFLMNMLVQDATFINRYSVLCDILTENTIATLVDCWNDPWDQFIGVMLFYKSESIMEENARLHSLTIQHLSDDGLTYKFTQKEMDEASLFDEKFKDRSPQLPNVKVPWYHRADTSINDIVLADDETDEVYGYWQDGPTWNSMGLGWIEEKEIKSESGNSTNVIHMPFRPKIVK